MGLTQVKKDGIAWPVTGAIGNADINASAAIAGSKLANLVSNDADNRLLTATGTANSFNGEANLTFDGTALLVNKTGGANIKVNSGGSNVTSIWTTGGTGTSWGTTSNDFATIITNNTERLRVKNDGRVLIGQTTTQIPGLGNTTVGIGLEADNGAFFGSRADGGQVVNVNNNAASNSPIKWHVSGTLIGHLATSSSEFGFETNGAKNIYFSTNGAERMRIHSGGQVAIGSDSAVSLLSVRAMANGNIHFRPITSIHSGTGVGIDILNNDNSAVQDLAIRAVQTVFRNASSESMRIDSDGRLLINHTGNTAVQGTNAFFQIEGTGSGHEGALGIYANMASSEGAHLLFSKSRGTSAGSVTAVQSGDRVADIGFAAADGNDRAHLCAQIRAEIDNTPGTDDVPGRLTFRTTADGGNNTTERMRLDSKGGCLIGSETYGGGGAHPRLYIVGNNGRQVKIHNPDSETSCLQLTNNATGQGDDNGAKFAMLGDSSLWIANDENNKIRLATNNTERMRIGGNQGSVYCGNVTSDEVSISSSAVTQRGATLNGGGDHSYHILASNSHTTLFVCRRNNDGTLLSFWQDTGNEGSISVSGSTVSYNGGHLSRWSQLDGISSTDKSTRPTIYQGTVMTNLDKMCEWKHTDVLYKEGDDIPEGKAVGDVKEAAHTEVNQQLNMTAVSSSVGDKNIAGVFWTWDDEDDEYVNDFYIAMTGDMVIRVAGSVTVERGDLMESAGDGTAKPQADDIIRSKTIAKIASTIATATYPDGSKAYPCALMAC